MPTDRPDPGVTGRTQNAGASAREWASDRLAVAAYYDDARTLLAALARSKKPEHHELYDVLLAGVCEVLREVSTRALAAQPPGWRKVARQLEACPRRPTSTSPPTPKGDTP